MLFRSVSQSRYKFQTIAPNTIQKLYTEIINNYELEKTLTIINQISHDNHYETSYDIWFTQVTTTINNLYTIEQKLLEQTQISINQSAEKIQNKLSLFIMITLVIIILMLFVIHFISTNIIQSTQKLEKSYETSQQLLQQYKDAIDKSFIVSKTDKAGIITYVNEQFCEISGYSIHELIGSSHNIIRHPDTSKETFQELWTTIQKGKRWHGVIKNRKKDGNAYWLERLGLLLSMLALALMKTLSTACRFPRTMPLETHILKTSLNKFKNTSSPYKPRVRLMVLCQGSCSCTS